MYIGPTEFKEITGTRPVSPAVLRMALRENARDKAQAADPQPRVYPANEDPFYAEDKKRLKALLHRPCMHCGGTLFFDGIILYCLKGHGWSNPQVAEDEIG